MLSKLILLFSAIIIFNACSHAGRTLASAPGAPTPELTQVWECSEGKCGYRYYGAAVAEASRRCSRDPQKCQAAPAPALGIETMLNQRMPAQACAESCCDGHLGCWVSCPTKK